MAVADYDVSKSEDGKKILIIADDYAASFVDGTWHRKILFKPEEIRVDFITVENAAEAKRLRDQAVKALNLG